MKTDIETLIQKDKYAIYELICPIDNTPFYVGFTSNVKRRYLEHLANCTGNACMPKHIYIKKLKILGMTPSINIVEWTDCEDKAKRIEYNKILEYKDNYAILNRITYNPDRRVYYKDTYYLKIPIRSYQLDRYKKIVECKTTVVEDICRYIDIKIGN